MAEYHLRRDVEDELMAPNVPFFNDPPMADDTIFTDYPPFAWDASLDWDMPNFSHNMGIENPTVSLAAQTPFQTYVAGQTVTNRNEPPAWTLSGKGEAFLDWDNANGARIEDTDMAGPLLSLGPTEDVDHPRSMEHAVHDLDLAISGLPISVAGPTVATDTAKAKPLSKKDWDEHQTRITKLYSEMTLKKVMQRMREEHKFIATKRMYKRRIQEWGLDKNNKEREMRAIARKHYQRAAQHKTSIFKVRGKKVDYPEIIRYFARKHVSIPEIVAQRAASKTPEGIACLTPILSTVTTPNDVALPELLFSTIRDYMDGSFDSETWIQTEESSLCRSSKDFNGASQLLDIVENRCVEAGNLIKAGAIKEAELALGFIEPYLSQLLLSENPGILHSVVRILTHFYQNSETLGLALRVISMIVASGAEILGQQHPLRRIFECFQKTDSPQFLEAGNRCLEVVADRFENSLGAMHVTSLRARCDETLISSKTLEPLLRRCQAELGIYDERTLRVHINLAWNLYDHNRNDLACVACREVFTNASQIQGTEVSLIYRAASLHQLALCQRMMDEDQRAFANMRRAIDLRRSYCGPWDSFARSCILELRSWLLEDDQAEEEAEVWRWWNLLAFPPAEMQNADPGFFAELV